MYLPGFKIINLEKFDLVISRTGKRFSQKDYIIYSDAQDLLSKSINYNLQISVFVPFGFLFSPLSSVFSLNAAGSTIIFTHNTAFLDVNYSH